MLGNNLKELLDTKNWSSKLKYKMELILYWLCYIQLFDVWLVTFSQILVTLVQNIGNWVRKLITSQFLKMLKLLVFLTKFVLGIS